MWKIIKKQQIKNVIFFNKYKFLLLIFVLTIGIICGMMTLKLVSQSGITSIKDTFTNFSSILQQSEITFLDAFFRNFFSNIYFYFTMTISGMFLIGMPVVAFMMFLKGYLLGFSMVAIIEIAGFVGIIPAVFGLILPNVLIIICFLFGSVFAIENELTMFYLRKIPMTANERVKYMSNYFGKMIIVFIALIISIAIEALLQPYIFKIFM